MLVERIRRAGAIPIGKTNVPEFGMGSQTYNRVYGTTRNPYDRTKTAGGSSGGAAAALATGMLPIADGGDLGGSLRNPANFNNIVALRPTRRPGAECADADSVRRRLVEGRDGALGGGRRLRAERDGRRRRARSAVVCDRSRRRSRARSSAICSGVRVAWCPDLGGLPLDPRVRAVLEAQRKTFEELGCIVEEACPDFGNVNEIFLTLRTWASWNIYRTVARAASRRR